MLRPKALAEQKSKNRNALCKVIGYVFTLLDVAGASA